MVPLLFSLILTAPPGAPTITAYAGTAIAGTGINGYTGDGGPATKATLDNPFAVAFDSAGNLYFSDTNNHVVRRIDAKTNVITTVAGTGKKGYTGDGGPAVKATLNEPYGIAVDSSNNLYIVDRLNARIRTVSGDSGVIQTLAGSGKGSGPSAEMHKFGEPNGICLLDDTRLLVADVKDQLILKINIRRGMIESFAGTGEKKTAGDGGPAGKASFAGARAVVWSPLDGGTTYVVEREGNCVRRIDAKGVITRYAGTGRKGYTGDGGPAKEATFDGPKEIAVDKEGNVFVVDTENEVIRCIDAKTDIITTVAGKGKTKPPGLGDDGPARAATLGRPHGVAIGPDGAIYIGDTLSHRIRRVK